MKNTQECNHCCTKNDQDKIALEAEILWSEYNESVENFRNDKLTSDPGYFSKSPNQRFYELSQSCPLPSNIFKQIPLLSCLHLPLKVHLIRSPILGCSPALNFRSVTSLLEMVNQYWEQAGIHFELNEVQEHDSTASTSKLTKEIENDIYNFLTHKLRRGPNGKMMHKHERYDKFVNVLLASFGHHNNESMITKHPSFHVWFMDMTGNQSQGICIDRKTKTIILGERSTKGYDSPTTRPHEYLAKTAAHELGHALSLNHPHGRFFEDGQSQIINMNRKNLMSGGVDKYGGGGSFLEQWQICQARNSAERFLTRNFGIN